MEHYLKCWQDKVAFCIFILGGPLDAFYELAVVQNHYLSKRLDLEQIDAEFFLFLGLNVFCAIQIYWNLYLVTTTDNRTQQKGGSKQCETCLRQIMPQSHHCKLCGVCIKRRDHHCWFAGNCIGLENQGNFCLLTFYIWLAAVNQNFYNLQFVIQVLGCDFWMLSALVLPHFPIFIKEFSAYAVSINFMTFLGLLLLIFFSNLLYTQLVQLITGLTRHERKVGAQAIPTSPSTRLNVELIEVIQPASMPPVR